MTRRTRTMMISLGVTVVWVLAWTLAFTVIPGGPETSSEPTPSGVATPPITGIAEVSQKPKRKTPATTATTAPPDEVKVTRAPRTPSAPRTSRPPAENPFYASCAAARDAGAAPLHRGDPGYRAGLDRDGDGVACE